MDLNTPSHDGAAPVHALPHPSVRPAKLFRWPVGLAVAAALVLGATWLTTPQDGSAAALIPAEIDPGFGPRTHEQNLAAVEQQLAYARERFEQAPGEWLRGEILARALMARFRLLGDPADLMAARDLIDTGLDLAPTPGGPVLAKAQLALTLHDLDTAEAALDRFDTWAARSPVEKSETRALRADIAVQRGQLDVAKRLLDEADYLSPATSITMRKAQLALYRGDLDDAATLAERAIKDGGQPSAMAQKALLRANIAYAGGDVATAGRWIDAAVRWQPDDWLAQSYQAQQRALRGDSNAAIAELRRIARESGRVEVMDALAHHLRLAGKREESLQWTARAQGLWRAKMKFIPGAARLHAAEHELALGDPADALAMVQREANARSYGPALAQLARAENATGDPRSALQTVRSAQQKGFRSTSLAMEEAQALRMLGRDGEAEATIAALAKRNALATSPELALIWFGHD